MMTNSWKHNASLTGFFSLSLFLNVVLELCFPFSENTKKVTNSHQSFYGWVRPIMLIRKFCSFMNADFYSEAYIFLKERKTIGSS